MIEAWDGQNRRAGTDRRKAQIPERAVNAFDAATEEWLTNLGAPEKAAIEQYLNRNTGDEDRQKLLEGALKNLFPVILGKDATRTKFTPYFLLIRKGSGEKSGYAYPLQQGIEGGHVDDIFDWQGGSQSRERKIEVHVTIKPAKMIDVSPEGGIGGWKWTPVERGVVD